MKEKVRNCKTPEEYLVVTYQRIVFASFKSPSFPYPIILPKFNFRCNPKHIPTLANLIRDLPRGYYDFIFTKGMKLNLSSKFSQNKHKLYFETSFYSFIHLDFFSPLFRCNKSN